jgi:hypothetical protein
MFLSWASPEYQKTLQDLDSASSAKDWQKTPRLDEKFLTYLGRELQIKLVLSSIPTYFLIVFKLPKFRRSFFWRGKSPEQVKGGHCLVN